MDCVSRIASVELTVGKGNWPYAENHKSAIANHWNIATARNANFFNGTVHVISHLHKSGDHVSAHFIATEFKNLLYWRDEGFPAEAKVLDGFGSALIRSSEGYIVLGRQRAGNINEGLAYLPGGFIDHRDVTADGIVDIRSSIARELLEETGLGAPTLSAEPGFLLIEVAAHVSFTVPCNSAHPADELKARIEAHIGLDANSELVEVVVVRHPGDLKYLPMPHYARVLLNSPLAWLRS